ncbi:dihydrofolate reductase family protein [Rhizobium sp. KVB221]|uniref:Dihydrofolate reductase family protein n=1 Tax=Rhizobium setariae TaxID=2801340 RepID=A0A937CML7_9HYPH|nr:dihydrofolate reductase family protein [Rhizobium setariae]MBL0372876.1 dihydrofolate reductase family protein [Rhizobium setariae]
MRKIIAAVFVSLDGIMQAPGGPEEDPTGGFSHGGWVFHYFDEALGGAMDELFSKPFDLLLGRKTYEIFAAYWPQPGAPDPIASLFNRATKYVATRTNPKLQWQNSKSLGDDIVSALTDLRKSNGPDLLIQGSSNLIQTLLENNLIDEFRLLIFPLMLGNGKRLFGEGTVPSALKLVETRGFPTGVVLARYQPAGELRTGSFALENSPQA